MTYDLTRFNQFVAEGRIVRNKWEGHDDEGRETACLIAAIAPGMRPNKCPADLMPRWLAELTPGFDDKGSLAVWPAMVQRYAAAANRWHVLDEVAWRRCLLKTLRASLEIALPHDTSSACSNVIALIDREIGGDIPTKNEWEEKAAAAEAWAEAAWAAAWEEKAAAAEAAVWDKITNVCLSAIEAEIATKEV
jgi:hypothetical protein